MAAEIERIALFPLNIVLFPGMVLPLQVFEPRYLQMISDIGTEAGIFGVTLIREGEEVGESAVPFAVGTLARIEKALSIDDGRYLLHTQGTRRFRVQRVMHDRPYLRGEVEYLPEARVDRRRTRTIMSTALDAYRQYIDAVRALGGNIDDAPTDVDADVFSWTVAATLIVAPPHRQELLEIDDVVVRLKREVEFLNESTRVLRARAERQTGPQQRQLPFSLN